MILLQYENVIQKIKNKYDSKVDLEFKRKIGSSFENLPAIHAKYHHGCYNKYLSRNMHRNKVWIGPQYCFSAAHKLFKSIARRIITQLLHIIKTFKYYLQGNNYENFDLYTTQKLKKKNCCNTMDLLL